MKKEKNYVSQLKKIFGQHDLSKINEYLDYKASVYERFISIKIKRDLSPEKQLSYMFLKTQHARWSTFESKITKYHSISLLINNFYQSKENIFMILDCNNIAEFFEFIWSDQHDYNITKYLKPESPASEGFISFKIPSSVADKYYLGKSEITSEKSLNSKSLKTAEGIENDKEFEIEFDLSNIIMPEGFDDVKTIEVYIAKEDFDEILDEYISLFFTFLILKRIISVLNNYLINKTIFNLKILKKIAKDYEIKIEWEGCIARYERKYAPMQKSSIESDDTAIFTENSKDLKSEKQLKFKKLRDFLIPQYLYPESEKDLECLFDSSQVFEKIVFKRAGKEIYKIIELALAKNYLVKPEKFDVYDYIIKNFKPDKNNKKVSKDYYSRKQLQTVQKHVILGFDIDNFFKEI